MAAFKKKGKEVRQREVVPSSREPRRREDPESILGENPSWRFLDCDAEGAWAFNSGRMAETFWRTVFPKMQLFERMTWRGINLEAKKEHHQIETASLSKKAQKRLEELRIEADSIQSLRLGSKIRLYGYLVGPVMHVLWYDDDHGDNETCVCRSKLKHT